MLESQNDFWVPYTIFFSFLKNRILFVQNEFLFLFCVLRILLEMTNASDDELPKDYLAKPFSKNRLL